MNRLRLIATFMMVLILTLPFYTASVFADVGLDVTVSGSNNVDGWRKESDSLKVNASVLIWENQIYDVIGPGQLTIDGETFNGNCVTSNDKRYYCFHGASSDTVTGEAKQYTIKLFDDGSAVKKEVKSEILIDKREPVVRITKLEQGEDGIEIGYNVKDTAVSPSDAVCSGIKRIEFYEASRLLDTIYIDDQSCSERGTFVSVSKVDGTEERTISVKAYDMLYQLGEADDKLFVDGTRPVIDVSSFAVYSENGRRVTSLRANAKSVISAKVEITEDIGLAEVKADFSALDADAAEVMAQEISVEDDVYTYEWTGINAEIADGTTSVTITVEVKDSNGNSRRHFIDYDVGIESDAPTIKPGSFKMFSGDIELHHLSSSQTAVDKFEVHIFEDNPGLNKGTVWLDLTDMGGGPQVLPNDCSEVSDGLWKCTWFKVDLVPESTNFVKITAADEWGNTGETTISYNIDIDDTNPEVVYLGTLNMVHPDQEETYTSFATLEEENTVMVVIDESESGIRKENVELTGWDGEFESTKPDKCEYDGEYWKCYWEDIDAPKNTAILSLNVVVRDNVGHLDDRLEDTKAYVAVDTDEPVITKISVLSVTQTGYLNYHKSMDVLLLSVEAEDMSQPEIIANLEKLNLGKNLTGECKPTGKTVDDITIWTCEIQTRPVPVVGYKQKKFDFDLIDVAGNEVEARDIVSDLASENKIGFLVEDGRLAIDILEADYSQVEVDVWKHEFDDTVTRPAALDRNIVSIINTRMYFSIDLKKRVSGSADIIDIYLDTDSCEGSAVPFIDSLELMNVAGSNKRKPFILANFKKMSTEPQYLELTCNLNIISKLDDKILIITPEIENVTLPIRFYNMPLGNLADQYEDKIERIKNDWIGPGSWFGRTMHWLSTIVKFAKGICTLFKTLEDVRKLLAVLGIALDALGASTEAFGGGEVPKAGCELRKAFDSTVKDLAKAVDGLCGYVTCKCDSKDETTGKESKGCIWNYDVQGAGSMIEDSDPFKSIGIAIMQGCVPGVIHGIEKYRQIQCTYIACMQQDVAAGFRVEKCDQMKAYLTCKYVAGEILYAIPFIGIYEEMVGTVRQMFEDPLALLGMLLGTACGYICKMKPGTNALFTACKIVDIIAMAGKMYGDYKDMFTDENFQKFLGLKGDLCADLVTY